MGLSEDDILFINNNFPSPFNSVDRYKEFIQQRIPMHGVLCTTAISAVNTALKPLVEKYPYRFFCRIDDSHSLKSPESIIDKIRRSQVVSKKDSSKKPYDINMFHTQMNDIARFRIVCNFLSDVDEIADWLEKSDELKGYFNLSERKSSIDQHPDERSSGERSIKLVLEHKKTPGLFIEIQIVTQLQEAWDKKDHYLVYETRRRHPEKIKENFADYLDAKMFAMAELLYVADQYFEQLRRSKEERKP